MELVGDQVCERIWSYVGKKVRYRVGSALVIKINVRLWDRMLVQMKSGIIIGINHNLENKNEII